MGLGLTIDNIKTMSTKMPNPAAAEAMIIHGGIGSILRSITSAVTVVFN